jgi:hypothetical protein
LDPRFGARRTRSCPEVLFEEISPKPVWTVEDEAMKGLQDYFRVADFAR